ncbi:MAG: peroxiredoxin, partial [Thermoleophilia bacterium]
MARLEAGQPAPDFSLQADDGSTVSLADLAGQTVALYFYPKDDTSGCTAQACEFRDMQADYDAAGIRVIGVSP